MKFLRIGQFFAYRLSLPVRGAWIEIFTTRGIRVGSWSLPVRGAWIEINSKEVQRLEGASLPVRGAWIEIHTGDER